MLLSEMKKLYGQYIAGTYARTDLGVASGQNAALRDVQEQELVDFSSGIGVNSLGFCSPQWVSAVTEQVQTLAHISNLYYTEPQARLAKALCERTGMQKVFFANSGAEANEGAIKTARKYGSDHYSHSRCEIITLRNSFHGRTIATLAATGQDVFHKNFGPFPAGFLYAEPNDIADLKAKVSANTCAIMLECIQGEGGVLPLDESYVKAIQALCKEQDILLIADEVQTGVGRTGKFLCGEYFGLTPDIVTLAKGLGGGLPIGAVLFGEKTKNTLAAGDHGSTFGGNPVVCAGALAVLEAMDGRFLDAVAEKGAYITEKVKTMSGVLGVTGRGMMLGIALEEGLVSAELAKECVANGLVILTAKQKLRMLPPLTITYGELDKGLAILEKVLKEATARLVQAQQTTEKE